MAPTRTSRLSHSTARTPAGLPVRPVGVNCGLVVGGTPHAPVGVLPGGTGGDDGVGSLGVGEVVMHTALTIWGGVKQLVRLDVATLSPPPD